MAHGDAIRRLTAAATLTLAVLIHGDARAEDAERARFEAEYPAALKLWEGQYARVKGSFTVERAATRLSPGMPRPATQPPPTKATFAVDHGFRKVETDRTARLNNKTQTTRSVLCLGDDGKRAFSLTRPAPDQPYSIRKFNEPVGTGSTFGRDCGDYVFAPFRFLTHTLPGIYKARTGKLLGVEATPADRGGGGVRVKMERGVTPQPMEFVLDPDAGWAIRRSEIAFGPPIRPEDPDSRPTIRFEIDYGPPVGGLPVPRVVRRYEGKFLESTCTFDSIRFEPTPAEEFSLAHYGLAEPAGAASSAGSRIPPIVLVGLACVLLAVVVGFARLAIRSRQAHARASPP
jgi:hypothetical protein